MVRLSRPIATVLGGVTQRAALLASSSLLWLGCNAIFGLEEPELAVAPCPAGFERCDGACSDLRLDPAHCGACGNACQSDEACTQGVCELRCSGGTIKCGEVCVSSADDAKHCGGCDMPCQRGQVCANGSCTLNCSPGTSPCDGACVDLASSPQHCGGCGYAWRGKGVRFRRYCV